MKDYTIDTKWLFIILLIYSFIYIFGYVGILKLNTLIWLVLFVVTLKFFDRKNRVKAKTEKIQTIFIVILSYFIIYYITGLFFGFSKSPYAHDIISLIKNFWNYLVIVFFQEYVRSVIVSNYKKDYILLILSIFIFSIFELNIVSLTNNFSTIESVFKYSFSIEVA